MLGYVLKRLLLLLPTLWIICSLVFFLSKIVPGTCLDVALERTSQSLANPGKVDLPVDQEPIVPLFYFSVRSRAEPDSLYRLRPELHQTFLRNLTLQSGNWPEVAAFYSTLNTLNNSQPSGVKTSSQILNRQIQTIYTVKELQAVEQALVRLKSRALHQALPQPYLKTIEKAQQQLRNIQGNSQSVNVFIPALTWHGANNQYHAWFTAFILGDMGISCRNEEPVNTVIAEAFTNTFYITFLSLGLLFVLALELSIWLSKAASAKWRQPVLAVLYAVDSVPLFIIALFLLTLFANAAYFNVFPVYGTGADVPTDMPVYITWVYQLPFLALPVISLTIVNLPYVTGQIYQAIQQVQGREFVLTAKAKGLPEQAVLRRHVLRNALLPVITLLTGFLPALVTGAVVIEIIYAVPGMGHLLHDSVLFRDSPVLIGIVLYLGLIKILANVLADLLYYRADPRIRIQA